MAQCAELCWQLRGLAGARRQVRGVRRALQHNIGLGGACVLTAYELGWPERVPTPDPAREPEHLRRLERTLASAQYVKKQAK